MKYDDSKYYESLCEVNQKAYLLFKEHKRDASVFIECGCHEGNTCEKAIYLGYKQIYSCDTFSDRVLTTQKKLKKYNIPHTIKTLDSVSFLKETLPNINKKSTLWLDAHGEGGGVPLLEELKVIKDYSEITSHSILIDDLQVYFKNDIDIIKDKIREINPKYKFSFGYIHHKPDTHPDILVAHAS